MNWLLIKHQVQSKYRKEMLQEAKHLILVNHHRLKPLIFYNFK